MSTVESPCIVSTGCGLNSKFVIIISIINTRQVTRATHARNRICPRVKLIIKIKIILLIIFLGFIKSKSC